MGAQPEQRNTASLCSFIRQRPAYKADSNGGVNVVGVLGIDLDAWAGAWFNLQRKATEQPEGLYVCRYTERLPKEILMTIFALLVVGLLYDVLIN
jgi:hypothetical protein